MDLLKKFAHSFNNSVEQQIKSSQQSETECNCIVKKSQKNSGLNVLWRETHLGKVMWVKVLQLDVDPHNLECQPRHSFCCQETLKIRTVQNPQVEHIIMDQWWVIQHKRRKVQEVNSIWDLKGEGVGEKMGIKLDVDTNKAMSRIREEGGEGGGERVGVSRRLEDETLFTEI